MAPSAMAARDGCTTTMVLPLYLILLVSGFVLLNNPVAAFGGSEVEGISSSYIDDGVSGGSSFVGTGTIPLAVGADYRLQGPYTYNKSEHVMPVSDDCSLTYFIYNVNVQALEGQ